MGTKIEWTEETWNPVTGCTKISPGCAHCYAERMAMRLRAMGLPKYRNGFQVTCHEDALDKPRRWRKPRRIFVCSMSDLFHEEVSDGFIERIWDVMWSCPQHTFIVLTKRVDRLVDWVSRHAIRRHFGWTDIERVPFRCGGSMNIFNVRMRDECGYNDGDKCLHPLNDNDGVCEAYACPLGHLIDTKEELVDELGRSEKDFTWIKDDNGEEYAEDVEDGDVRLRVRPRDAMAANVWLGFTAENQERYEYAARQFRSLRWDLGPYATLFASLEPLLERIHLPMKYWEENDDTYDDALWSPLSAHEFSHGSHKYLIPYLDWVIVGGESGPGARPMDPDWARDIRDQCVAAGVPFFFKQWGGVNKKKTGRILDGRTWDEMPETFWLRRTRMADADRSTFEAVR